MCLGFCFFDHILVAGKLPAVLLFICVGVLVCCENKLVTGSNTKKLRLWSVASVQNLSNDNNKSSRTQNDG